MLCYRRVACYKYTPKGGFFMDKIKKIGRFSSSSPHCFGVWMDCSDGVYLLFLQRLLFSLSTYWGHSSSSICLKTDKGDKNIVKKRMDSHRYREFIFRSFRNHSLYRRFDTNSFYSILCCFPSATITAYLGHHRRGPLVEGENFTQVYFLGTPCHHRLILCHL